MLSSFKEFKRHPKKYIEEAKKAEKAFRDINQCHV